MKTIKFGLSVKEMQSAIKEVEKYRDDINRKAEELCRRLTAEGIQTAQAHIGSSGFGKYIRLSSEITPEQAGCRAVFYMEDVQKITRKWQTKEGIQSATLSPALLLEFGSGLEAENPAGIAGVGQGSFPGQTHAFDSGGWSYMDLGGMWHHTTGVEPDMPMYFAGKELREKVLSIARDVFK